MNTIKRILTIECNTARIPALEQEEGRPSLCTQTQRERDGTQRAELSGRDRLGR